MALGRPSQDGYMFPRCTEWSGRFPAYDLRDGCFCRQGGKVALAANVKDRAGRARCAEKLGAERDAAAARQANGEGIGSFLALFQPLDNANRLWKSEIITLRAVVQRAKDSVFPALAHRWHRDGSTIFIGQSAPADDQSARLGSRISAVPVHMVVPFWLVILCFTWIRWRPSASTILSTTSAVWMVTSPDSAGPR